MHTAQSSDSSEGQVAPAEYVSEEEMMLSEEERLQEIEGRMQVFGARLDKLKGDAVKGRSMIEQRWLEDYRQYHGVYDDETLRNLKDGGSKIFANITRNKTSAAEARLQDMLFPTDDRNWALSPTPEPELDGFELSEDQQQAEAIRRQIIAEAKKRCDAMQNKIDDQLTQANYEVKSRDAIHDSAKLGTGILKAPVIVARERRSWDTGDTGLSTLNVSNDLDASVERVDPWHFYPDPTARTIHEAEYTFEYHRHTKKQLRDFAKTEGVLIEQLKDVLRESPTSSSDRQDHIDDIRAITGVDSVTNSGHYEVWEYRGVIDKQDLIAAGMELDEDNPLEEFMGTVFLAEGRVIKVALDPSDNNHEVYSVFNWEKDESSIFGFGVPFLMRNPQKVINASMRMILDNAGLSVADQIIVNQGLVVPADGKWEMAPKKVWLLKDATRSVSEAFASFATQSHQVELSNIFGMARQLADEETNLPLIAQGEQSQHVTKTSSGMAMLMNSANIVLRRAVKNWDDEITGTIIPRFYDYNMEFDEDPSIKGDFNVDARGSGALLVREKQQENLMIYANVAASNPEFSARTDWEGLQEKIAQSLEVPSADIMLSKEAYQEKQQQMAESQGGNPELEMMQAEFRLKQEAQQFDADVKKAKLQLEHDSLEIDLMKHDQKMEQDREMAMLKIASTNEITMAQLQQKAEEFAAANNTKREGDLIRAKLESAKQRLQALNLSQKHDTF